MKFMNQARKYGRNLSIFAVGSVSSISPAFAQILTPGDNPVENAQAGVEADIAIVIGVLLAVAVVLWGGRKVISIVR